MPHKDENGGIALLMMGIFKQGDRNKLMNHEEHNAYVSCHVSHEDYILYKEIEFMESLVSQNSRAW